MWRRDGPGDKWKKQTMARARSDGGSGGRGVGRDGWWAGGGEGDTIVKNWNKNPKTSATMSRQIITAPWVPRTYVLLRVQ